MDYNPYSYGGMPTMPFMAPYGTGYSQGYNNTAMPQQSQQQAQQQQTPNVIYVNTLAQAKEVPLNPNTKAIVIVQNDPVIVMLDADNMGLINRRYFNITEFNPDEMKPAQNDYITRAEFAPIQQFIAQLQEQAKPDKTEGEK